jgi:AraC-like DNA-binding protein
MRLNNTGDKCKYLNVTDYDRNFGISVNSVGFQAVHPHTSYPNTIHPSGYYFNPSKGRILHEYQIVYITKGKGFLSLNYDEKQELSKGHIFILLPGQWHSYYPCTESGWNEYYIGFSGEMANRLLQYHFISSENQILDVGLNEELVSLFSKAIEVAGTQKAGTQQYLAGIVMHIIGQILAVSKYHPTESTEISQKIEQAKIIMNENVYKNIDPETLAMKLNISYSWFRKVFKDYTGFAPAKYFQELKLRKAKQMLISSSNTVKEIAYMLDFNSTEHFFSLFKKTTGFTPLEYRAFGRASATEKPNNILTFAERIQ